MGEWFGNKWVNGGNVEKTLVFIAFLKEKRRLKWLKMGLERRVKTRPGGMRGAALSSASRA